MPYWITPLPPSRDVNPAYTHQPKQVLNLAIPDGCKAELTDVV